jgi:hypothetical protein
MDAEATLPFRLYGLLSLAAAIAVLWYCRPTVDGTLRYPKQLKKYVETIAPLAVVFLLAIALPLLLFGAPGTIVTSAQ